MKKTPPIYKDIARLISSGKTVKEITELLGCTSKQVYNCTVKTKENARRGPVLSEEDAEKTKLEVLHTIRRNNHSRKNAIVLLSDFLVITKSEAAAIYDRELGRKEA